MPAQETNRQHFVPRTYLKHFGFGPKQDKIFVLGKQESNADRIRPQRVGEVCHQNKLYTMPGATVEERMELENFYQSVEDDYNRLQALLTNSQITTLSENDRNEILLTVGTMLHRTTRLLSIHNQVVDEALEQMYRLAEMTGVNSFADGYSIAGKSLAQVQAEMREQQQTQQVLTQLKVALRFVEISQDHHSIIVTMLDENAGEYLTSDNPVWIFALTKPRTAFNPSASLRLPIGPKHMLILQPIPASYTPEISDLVRLSIIREQVSGDNAKAQRLTANLLMHENSERWLLGSQAELIRHVREWEVTQQRRVDGTKFSAAQLREWELVD
jgi:hypothetical protein